MTFPPSGRMLRVKTQRIEWCDNTITNNIRMNGKFFWGKFNAPRTWRLPDQDHAGKDSQVEIRGLHEYVITENPVWVASDPFNNPIMCYTGFTKQGVRVKLDVTFKK